MSEAASLWGEDPSARYENLAAPFRPVFGRIRERAEERDLKRDLPWDEIAWLKEAGFARFRIPENHGGAAATLPELFALLIELAAADPNLTNIFRSHMNFVEDLVNASPGPWLDHWLSAIGAGQMTGSGFSEQGAGVVGTLGARLFHRDGQLLITGQKFYTTGSLYADWINAVAFDESETLVSVLVPTRGNGVEILDDWDGFGQALTASGTARFTDVSVAPIQVKPSYIRFPYLTAFAQLVHLASLAGIGRAAAEDLARLVRARDRSYGRGTGGRTSEDPQILQVVGAVRSAAYAARAIVLQNARALQRAHEAFLANDEERVRQTVLEAELEVSQSVTVVSTLVLDAATRLFDALGASAARKGLALDRHWRNARTITSHNPRIYHDRLVGDYAVNGSLPPAEFITSRTSVEAKAGAA